MPQEAVTVTDRKTLRTVEAVAILLFFVQAVRVLFSVLFGIIYDLGPEMNKEVASS